MHSFVGPDCIEGMVPDGRRFSSGSIGLATRSSSNAARLGLLPEEPEEDADMYEGLAPASNILVDGFAVPKVMRCISISAILGFLQLLHSSWSH